jgi:hypothetical protein
MKLVIRHDAPVEIAKRGADAAFAYYVVRYAAYEPRVTWKTPRSFDFSIKAKGIRVNGTATLDDGTVAIEMSIPFVFRVLEARATAAVTREIRIWIDKVRLADAAG